MDTPAAERDVVLPLGPGGGVHPELRYALRSIAANLPHRRLILVGAAPPAWVVGADHMAVPQDRSKYENSTRNLVTACESGDLSEWFTLYNDDMYVMAPQPGGMPVFHRGNLLRVEAYYRAKGAYAYGVGLTQTRQMLESWGYDRARLVSYDIHVPMPMPREGVLDVIKRARDHRYIRAFHKRTAVGTVCELGGSRLIDPKVIGWGAFDETQPFLSSTKPQQMNGRLGKLLAARFPDPCRYERA